MEQNPIMVKVEPNYFNFNVSFPYYGFYQVLSDGSVYRRAYVKKEIIEKNKIFLSVNGNSKSLISRLHPPEMTVQELTKDINPCRPVSLYFDGAKFIQVLEESGGE